MIAIFNHVDRITLTADDQAVSVDASYLRLTSDSAIATLRTFTLSTDGIRAGHFIILEWVGTSTFGQLSDSGNCALSADWLPTANDTLTLIFNGSQWLEIGRSSN